LKGGDGEEKEGTGEGRAGTAVEEVDRRVKTVGQIGPGKEAAAVWMSLCGELEEEGA